MNGNETAPLHVGDSHKALVMGGEVRCSILYAGHETPFCPLLDGKMTVPIG